jgi:hypothetical protein
LVADINKERYKSLFIPLSRTRHSLRDSVTAEALEAIVDLDLDAFAAIVPPRGYGRD